jgi:hypothetical protein
VPLTLRISPLFPVVVPFQLPAAIDCCVEDDVLRFESATVTTIVSLISAVVLLTLKDPATPVVPNTTLLVTEPAVPDVFSASRYSTLMVSPLRGPPKRKLSKVTVIEPALETVV